MFISNYDRTHKQICPSLWISMDNKIHLCDETTLQQLGKNQDKKDYGGYSSWFQSRWTVLFRGESQCGKFLEKVQPHYTVKSKYTSAFTWSYGSWSLVVCTHITWSDHSLKHDHKNLLNGSIMEHQMCFCCGSNNSLFHYTLCCKTPGRTGFLENFKKLARCYNERLCKRAAWKVELMPDS